MIIELPTKILSQHLNDDGTLSLFIDVQELDGDEDFMSLTTDPVIDIQGMTVHSKDDKPVTLELRVGSWVAPRKGEQIILQFEPPRE
jgi:hypothetical protein